MILSFSIINHSVVSSCVTELTLNYSIHFYNKQDKNVEKILSPPDYVATHKVFKIKEMVL